jgi:hypothetical protein
MNQIPGTTKALGRLREGVSRIVVLPNSSLKIVCLTDVQFAVRVAQNVNVPLGDGVHSQIWLQR